MSTPESIRSNPKGRLASRINKNSPANEALSPNRRQIAVTSFDLLNGAYQTASRSRLASLIILSLVLVIGAGVSINGLTARVELSSVSSELLDLKSRERDATSKFTSFSGLPEGVTEKQLLNRYDSLTSAFKKISTYSVSTFDYYGEVEYADVQISEFSMEFRTSIGKISEEKKTNESRDATSVELTKELLANIDELVENEVLVIVKATAVGDPINLARWAQSVKNSKEFSNVIVTRTNVSSTIVATAVQRGPSADIAEVFTRSKLPIAEEVKAALTDSADKKISPIQPNSPTKTGENSQNGDITNENGSNNQVAPGSKP